MSEPVNRKAVRFVSDGIECAAWHYPGTNGACVIMAGGTAQGAEPNVPGTGAGRLGSPSPKSPAPTVLHGN